MNADAEHAAEDLATLAVAAEEASEAVEGWPRVVLERVAAHLSDLSEALADGDYARAESICPPRK